MKLLIMGPPGVGKGTQAEILKTEFSIAHLSTGEILRKEIAGESEVGIIAKHHIDKGQLVPDKVLLKVFSIPIPLPSLLIKPIVCDAKFLYL